MAKKLFYIFAFAVAGILITAAFAPELGLSKPCGAHKNDAKKVCIKQYKRDKQAWPKDPKEWEIKRRVGKYNWYKAARVANCETGGTPGATKNRGNLNWYPSGKFQGPLGMYRSTAAYGKRVTGYWSPDTWQEWVAVAYASHRITRGWSGWGCGGA